MEKRRKTLTSLKVWKITEQKQIWSKESTEVFQFHSTLSFEMVKKSKLKVEISIVDNIV